ncbi:MAG: glutamine amidotransferase [Myxococcales bacterium]
MRPELATNWQVGWGVPGGATTALVVGVVLLALCVMGSFVRVRGLRAFILIALRWLSALAIFALTTQPTFWAERVRTEPGSLAVVVDVSRSMGVRTDDTTRLARAQKLVEKWLKGPRGQEAEWFLLGDEAAVVEPTRVLKELKPRAPATALIKRLSELGTREDLGAIVVLSDGADTQTHNVPKALGARVHGVFTGDSRPLRDDAILRIQPDSVAFLHGQARVHVTLASTGLGDRALEVDLKREGAIIASEIVQVKDGGEASVELSFEPLNLGREVYTLELATDDRDDVPENNVRPFVARVTRDRMRVLHVSGRPSWDQRFLRGFLKRDPSIDLVSFFILRSVHDLTMSSPAELALIPFPTDELFRQHLTSFDVVLLQDFDYAPYQMAPYLPLIRDYVEQGGGLAMIGGSLSFDGGGYADTPLADALPVKIRPANPSGAVVVEGAFAPEPVAGLLHHPLLELYPEPAQTVAAFRSLDPLVGANSLLGVQSGGLALLEHPSARTPDGHKLPILTVGRFGRGRTLAFATDTSWHWSMPTAGRGKDPSAYDRFWDRAVRWLTRDPLLEPASLSLDRETYLPGARVEVNGLAREDTYRPIRHQELSVAIQDLGGNVHVQLQVQTDDQGRVQTILQAPEEPGAYAALLWHNGKEIARMPLVVELSGVELADPRPRPALLKELATRSGGRYIEDPDAAPALAELDASRTTSLGTERHAPFGQSSWALGLFVLIALEWALRRRWGER